MPSDMKRYTTLDMPSSAGSLDSLSSGTEPKGAKGAEMVKHCLVA